MLTGTPRQNTRVQAAAKPQNPGDSNRLPCRGCTRDCGNYPHCDGKPWRMPK